MTCLILGDLNNTLSIFRYLIIMLFIINNSIACLNEVYINLYALSMT